MSICGKGDQNQIKLLILGTAVAALAGTESSIQHANAHVSTIHPQGYKPTADSRGFCRRVQTLEPMETVFRQLRFSKHIPLFVKCRCDAGQYNM
jgi:hypothetical protein